MTVHLLRNHAGGYLSLCGRSGPLGLLPEQIDPSTGAFLGNYPQAFSHVGLISSGVNLARTCREAARLTIDSHGRNAKLIFSVTLRLDARSAGIYSRLEVRRRGRRCAPVEAGVSSNEYRDV